MTADAPLLVARDLRKSFPIHGGILVKRVVGQTLAVDDVSLSVQRGETLGLVGESGCGKSTTGRLLMRLIEPDSGSILFDGTDLTSLPPAALKQARRRLQLMFQDPSSAFNPRMRVSAIIAEPMRLAGLPYRDRQARVRELLPLVGLSDEHGDRYPHQFSGGQRQRIGIARALALRPDLIICDEPVSALDVSIQAQVVNLLQDLQGQFGLTYVFISHDLRVVRHLATTIAVMYLGRIVEQAPKAALFKEPQHPYTRMLLAAVPRLAPGSRPTRTIPIAGEAQPTATACRFAARCPLVMPICREEVPRLREINHDHKAACHAITP